MGKRRSAKVGANFVVLLVVKLVRDELVATLHTYLPEGGRHQSILEYTIDAEP
jgi:hypothetical protein